MVLLAGWCTIQGVRLQNGRLTLFCVFFLLSDGGSGEKRSAHRSKEEDKEKRAAQASHKHQEKHEDESHQRWAKTGQSTAVKHEAPHHSKEVSEEEEREERPTQASPEQKQLQMIARRRHEEKRGSEEEGSASRKSEVWPFPLQPAGKLLISTVWHQIRRKDATVSNPTNTGGGVGPCCFIAAHHQRATLSYIFQTEAESY